MHAWLEHRRHMVGLGLFEGKSDYFGSVDHVLTDYPVAETLLPVGGPGRLSVFEVHAVVTNKLY